ncbi:hypothetical protein [Corynebacterium afermentans]|uniref:hypothetical protein n=1 Tax=Corynebacterium afermentans TaxID=38286 RepID=UPI0025724CDD|nr:hypothetical protein [Corynebacterium afermentans]MDC7109707.1 hypothetical protein [Corynebacterium afermentans]
MTSMSYALTPVQLPEGATIRREPPRPVASRQDNYDELFDFDMIFADVFVDQGMLVAVGAPPLNLEKEILEANYKLDGKKIAPPTIEQRSLCSVYLFQEQVNEGSVLEIEGLGGRITTRVAKNHSSYFAGKDVLLALQKDNDLEWIAYWALHHSMVSGINAVLLYDNGSTSYGVEELLETLEQVPGIDRVMVCSSNCPFGPTGGPDGIWDSNYGQLVHYEHARRFALRESRSILVNDIDEIVGIGTGESVVGRLLDSPRPAIGIPRVNVLNVLRPGYTESDVRAHNVYGYVRSEQSRLHGKYAVKTQEMDDTAQLNVHIIRNTKFEKIRSDELVCGNFIGVSKTWRTGRFETRRNSSLDDRIQTEIETTLTGSMDGIAEEWNLLLGRLQDKGLVRCSKSAKVEPNTYEVGHPLSKTEGDGHFGSAIIEDTYYKGRLLEQRKIDSSRVRRTFHSLSELLSTDPSNLASGVYRVEHGLPIFVDWRNAGEKTLLVTFSAATTRAAENVPVFSGAGTTRNLDCNVLMISDPTMVLDRDTTVAWYAGNRLQPKLQDDIARLIQYFAQGDQVILLGGSGGGYAALVQHAKLPNATSLVFNASTRLSGRPIFQAYHEKLWSVEDPSELPNSLILDLRDVYRNEVSGEVYYVQNSFDQNFVKNYFWPFVEALHEENKFYFLTPFYANGHVPLSSDSIKSMLEVLIETDGWNERRAELSKLRLYGRKNLRNQIVD